jgi:hypothetical protein
VGKALYTLIQTAKLDDVDPQAWLADVLARIADHPATSFDELLPRELGAAHRSDRRINRATRRPRSDCGLLRMNTIIMP